MSPASSNNVMTRIHKTTRFEREITDKGGARRYASYVMFGINGDQKPTKKKLQRVPPQLLAQLQEVHNQPKEEKDNDKKELDDALKLLATRIKPAPGPPLPDSVWESIYCNDERRLEYYPKLNNVTKKELLKMAEQSDFHPASWMLALGEYLSTHFTGNEIGGFIHDLGMYNSSQYKKDHDPSKNMFLSSPQQPKQRSSNSSSISQVPLPKRIAQLAHDLILEAGDCTTWHTMEHTASRIMFLSKDEVKDAAVQVGLDGEGSKVQVVVRLIEMIYSDVLLPPPPTTHHQGHNKVDVEEKYQYSVA